MPDLSGILCADFPPLTTSKGENTSSMGRQFPATSFADHRPEYIGWVHDSGLSFRHETYPAYKATRES
jgi:DNA polymerase-1